MSYFDLFNTYTAQPIVAGSRVSPKPHRIESSGRFEPNWVGVESARLDELDQPACPLVHHWRGERVGSLAPFSCYIESPDYVTKQLFYLFCLSLIRYLAGNQWYIVDFLSAVTKEIDVVVRRRCRRHGRRATIRGALWDPSWLIAYIVSLRLYLTFDACAFSRARHEYLIPPSPPRLDSAPDKSSCKW